MSAEASAPGSARPGSGEMFDGIAARYDLLNRLMSLGLDQRWRRLLVDSLGLGTGARVLDLATGTGDVALAMVRRNTTITAVGVDPSRGMLDVAERKVKEAGLAGRIELRVGDAQSLAFEAGSFDAVTISFGIRNVPDRALGLREMRRVLRPGGRLGILELAEPDHTLFGPFARLHVRHLVPRLGALFSGSSEYRYLQQSIARFPHRDEFAKVIEGAGFEDVKARPLMFGACVLFTARAPRSAP